MKRTFLLLFVSIISLQAYNPQQIAVLKQNIAQGIQVNVAGCDFRGAGDLLLGIGWSGMQISGVLFDTPTDSSRVPFLISVPGQRTNLTNANFSQCSAVSTSFKGAILRDANFDKTNLLYANFTNADLTGAKLDTALNLATAIFNNAIMPDGKKCSGVSWKSKSGTVILCHCPTSK